MLRVSSIALRDLVLRQQLKTFNFCRRNSHLEDVSRITCTYRHFSTSSTKKRDADGPASDHDESIPLRPQGYLSRLRHSAMTWNPKPNSAAPLTVALRAGAGSFVGIGALCAYHYGIEGTEMSMVLGSFGASAVLVFGFPAAPFSQPRAVLGGHLLCATVGVSTHFVVAQLLGNALSAPMLAAPLGVALATSSMIMLGVVHPPAGGTCLIAILGSDTIHEMGFWFLLPTCAGAFGLVFSGWLLNNLSSDEANRYPASGWW